MAGRASDVRIRCLGDDEPVRFAARELRRYLARMTGRRPAVAGGRSYVPREPGVWVGVSDRFGRRVPARILPAEDPFADAVFVSSGKGHAVVTGANPRSVLFAAYRYLEELGCRWLRPGRNGERVPRVGDIWARRIRLTEVPSVRHRTMVNEGGCSVEHLEAMVDYAAKRGFNSYFLQLRDSYFVFDRWYGVERHRRHRRVRRISDAEAHRHCVRVKKEVLRRGLVVHSMGHGWTNWPLGIRGHDWHPVRPRIRPAARKLLAMVDGKRELFHGVPLNTNLCTSSPDARALMAEAVFRYARANPDEVVHVWLADGRNNTCECPGCRKALPSDFYVKLLNEIDERLSAAKLATRIVFLAYVDLLWAPRKERIRNPSRFMLMFAPITRSFSAAYLDQAGPDEKVRPYVRNRLVFPRTPRGNLRMLEAWRKAFGGECVLFDYHLFVDYVKDPGQMALLPVLHRDARDLDRLGMDGFLPVTTQRIAFPTGVWTHVLGRTLWNGRIRYGRVVGEYFRDLFGPGGAGVRRYLERLSKLFDPAFLRGEKPDDASRRGALRSLAAIPGLVAEFGPAIDRGCGSHDPVTASAWKVLGEHAWYAESLSRMLAAAYAGRREEAERLYGDFSRGLDRRLPRLHQVLDTLRARVEVGGLLRRQGVPVSVRQLR